MIRQILNLESYVNGAYLYSPAKRADFSMLSRKWNGERFLVFHVFNNFNTTQAFDSENREYIYDKFISDVSWMSFNNSSNSFKIFHFSQSVQLLWHDSFQCAVTEADKDSPYDVFTNWLQIFLCVFSFLENVSKRYCFSSTTEFKLENTIF